MHQHDEQQRPGFGLDNIERAEDEAGQSDAGDAAPVPFAQAVVEGVNGGTDQPAPANPAGPLRDGGQQETPEKELFHRTVDAQVVEALHEMIAERGPAEPGADHQDAVGCGKGGHKDADEQAEQELKLPVARGEAQEGEREMQNSDVEKRYGRQR